MSSNNETPESMAKVIEEKFFPVMFPWYARLKALEEFRDAVEALVEHPDPCWYDFCGLRRGEWNRCKKNYMCPQLKKRLTDALTVVTKPRGDKGE